METTVQITIPAEWLEGLALDEDELRVALRIGLKELRGRQAMADTDDPVLKALLSTGRVRPPSHHKDSQPEKERTKPPKLPGPPVSEILIAQRKRVPDELGRQLHDRATRGESLSEEERDQLEAWYILLDRAEMEMLGLAPPNADGDTV